MAKDAMMMSFLRQRKKAASKYAAEREAWKAALEGFARKLRSWLKEPIEEDLLEVHEETRQVTDPRLGQYDALCLDIQTPTGERILVRPLGFDADTSLYRAGIWSDTYSILLAWDPPNDKWFVADREDQTTFEPLTEQRFNSAFAKVLGA